MFLNEQNDDCHSSNHIFDRIVIGSGALGLFFSSQIQNEFPESHLAIISKSLPIQPILIQNLQGESKEFKLSNFFLVDNLNSKYPKIGNKNIIFYICLPPEVTEFSFQYIENLLTNKSGIKNVYLVFLNNGIVDYNLFYNLKKLFNKNISFFLIRAIVISGLMRNKFSDKTIITNNSGNMIYYGFLVKSNQINTDSILPKKYFNWVHSKEIFIMERAKFLVNFILGLCIGAKEIPNSNIFTILSKEKRKEIFLNYCSIFLDNGLTPEYLENYFNNAINNTAININSVSLSWFLGNKKPIEYFVANIEKMAYLSNNKEVHHFFKNLINTYY